MSAVESSSLRPAGFSDVFGSAFAAWWATLRLTAPAAALVLAPAYAVAFAIAAAVAPEALGDTFFSGGDVELDAEEAARAGSVALLTAAITGIASVVAFAVCFKAIVAAYAGAQRSFGSTLSHGLARGGSAFWVAALYALALLGIAVGALVVVGAVAGLGAAVAVPVGIVVAVAAIALIVRMGVSWSLGLASALADDERGTRALRRSAQLVAGRWWATFAVLLVAGIVMFVASLVLAVAFTAPVAVVESDVAGLAANSLAGLVSGALTTPLSTAFVAVLYYDLRVRKEGLELDDAARSVGERPDPNESPRAPVAAPANAPESPEPPREP